MHLGRRLALPLIGIALLTQAATGVALCAGLSGPDGSHLWLALGGGLAALVCAAVGAAKLIEHRFARLTGDLTARIARIGRGDYALPDSRTKDALGNQLDTALTDMTRELAHRERRIREAALQEPITGLPTRAAFLAAISAQTGTECAAAVLMIGFVHAQEIANTVNRDIADRVLRNAATRLVHLLGDMPLACLSDRTFAAFLSDANESQARDIAGQIVSLFETPYADGTVTIDNTAAVGIALKPEHGDDGAVLLRRAEVALQTGLRTEHRWAVYDHATDPHRPDRLSLMSDLRQGLGRGEFMLVYQPKLHLPTGRVTGAEALIRWQHPLRGVVPTSEFIALAEDTGNIGHITRWALRAGIEQAARWRAEGLDLKIAINVSARDLCDARLPSRVIQLLHDHQLGPEAISLEVTESTIMTNPAAAIAVLRRLADEHIAVSVDDFGVGRASLAYLRTLPVRELKIDKVFIDRLVEDSNDRKIVQSVVDLGHSLGFAVGVEGVEDAATLAIVADLGCDYVQGYYVARPLVPEMLERFMREPPPVMPA